jgi:hypothetical protein
MRGSPGKKRTSSPFLAVAAFAVTALANTVSASPTAAPVAHAAVPIVGECIPDQPVGLSGQRVAIDEHGRGVRALTAAENAALDKEIAGLIRQDVDVVNAKQAADGTLSVELDGAFMDFALARVDAAGKVTWTCVRDAAGVRAFLDPALAAAAPALEER